MGFRDIKNKKKKEKGSITLEASIFLVIFIVFYMAMMDLIQIARAQVVLQYAANEAAGKFPVQLCADKTGDCG